MTSRRPDRGFALLAVLWGAGLLAMLAAGVIADSRVEARISRNLVGQAAAQALADGAVRLAAARLVEARDSLPRDGTPVTVEVDGHRIAVSIQDVGGLIDLNAGSPLLLAALFRQAGLDDETAAALARAAVLRRAEAPSPGTTPRVLRPFELVADLASVSGMTPAILTAVAPLATVQARRGGIDPRVAPAAVLLALPGADRDSVTEYLARRRSDPTRLKTAAFHAPSIGDVYRIAAQAAGPAGETPAARVAVVRLTGFVDDPVWIHDWATQ